jgi:hypothetical protein
VAAGNAAIVSGKLVAIVQKFMAEHKPEAAYFYADDSGNRCGAMVLDMKDTSEIPGLAEPWFLGLNAQVTFRPVMNAQDLAAAGPGIARAVADFGK